MLVSEPLRVKGVILGTMMSNWGATMGMYDYRNVLGALEDFIDACSE